MRRLVTLTTIGLAALILGSPALAEMQSGSKNCYPFGCHDR